MKSKLIRFLKALRYESVKRLPWIVGLLVFLAAFTAWKSYVKTAEGVQIGKENSVVIKQQGETIKEQAKAIETLTKDNNRLAKEERDNTACVAKLFVGFINSHGSISNADVDHCQLILTGSGSSAASSGEPSSTSAQIGSSSSPPKSTRNGSTKQPDNPQPPSSQPAPLNCTIDLLGMHLFCPEVKP